MASSNLILGLLLLLFSSMSFSGRCQIGSEVTRTMPCLEMLIPCQNYLRTSTAPPECCAPFRDMIVNNVQCICSIFFNDALLATLNVTIQEAIMLPIKCGLENADPTICNAFELSTINLPPLASPSSTSFGGSSERNVGFRKFLTSTVAILVVSRMLLFTHPI